MSVPAWLTYSNQNATRDQPLSADLLNALAFLGEMGITANVYSGGQPAIGTSDARVGSTRHDNGMAGDFYLTHPELGMLTYENPAHIPILQDVVRRARAAGLTGIGMGPGYMGPHGIHLGFGAPAVWGAEGSSANAPDWLREAFYGAGGEFPQGQPTAAPQNALAGMADTGGMTAQQNALRLMELLRPPQMASNALDVNDFLTRRERPALIPIYGGPA